MNEYAKAAIEWLRGCSCFDKGAPEACEECTVAYRKHLQTLLAQDPEAAAEYGSALGHNCIPAMVARHGSR